MPLGRCDECLLEGRGAFVVRVLAHAERGLDSDLPSSHDAFSNLVKPWGRATVHDGDDRGFKSPDLLRETESRAQEIAREGQVSEDRGQAHDLGVGREEDAVRIDRVDPDHLHPIDDPPLELLVRRPIPNE